MHQNMIVLLWKRCHGQWWIESMKIAYLNNTVSRYPSYTVKPTVSLNYFNSWSFIIEDDFRQLTSIDFTDFYKMTQLQKPIKTVHQRKPRSVDGKDNVCCIFVKCWQCLVRRTCSVLCTTHACVGYWTYTLVFFEHF